MKTKYWLSIDEKTNIAHVTTDYNQAACYGNPMPIEQQSVDRIDKVLEIGIVQVVRHDKEVKR